MACPWAEDYIRPFNTHMPDEYQRGSDEDWKAAERDELDFMVRKRDSQIAKLRLMLALLVLALGWLGYKFYKAGGKPEDLIKWP